jgi:hypothetical protein
VASAPLFLNRSASVRQFVKTADTQALMRTLSAQLPDVASNAQTLAAAGLGNALEAILEVPLAEILKSACMEIAGAPQSSDRTLELVDFTLKSSHRPSIKVYCGEKHLSTIKFRVEIAIAVHAVQVTVRSARVARIKMGNAKGSVSIGYGELENAFEIGSQEFELPGEIDFPAPGAGA